MTSDVFGGFTYFRGSRDLFSNARNTPSLTGWDASYTLHLTNHFGLTGAASGAYGPVRSASGNDANVQFHSFLAGPQLSLVRTHSVDIFARALAGVGITDSGFSSRAFRGGDLTQSAFTAAFGGGVDWRLTNRFSYRILQPEYVMTRFPGGLQHSLQVSTGLVIRFGR